MCVRRLRMKQNILEVLYVFGILYSLANFVLLILTLMNIGFAHGNIEKACSGKTRWDYVMVGKHIVCYMSESVEEKE